MVDIWMICMLLYPFLIVSVLTIKEVVKNGDTAVNTNSTLVFCSEAEKSNSTQIKPKTKETNQKNTLKILDFILNKGLPSFIIAFIFIYWASGILNISFGSSNGICENN